MICLSPHIFAAFIAAAGLGYEINGPVVTVQSETPLMWIYRGGMMCAGGAKA